MRDAGITIELARAEDVAVLQSIEREAGALFASASVPLATTFRDVPWNGPFYASAGFRVIAPRELSPELEEIVQGETRRGLDASTRVVMRLRVGDRDASG